MEKFCYECDQDKDVSEFYRDARGWLGLSGQCKECTHKRNRENYRKRNEEKVKRAYRHDIDITVEMKKD